MCWLGQLFAQIFATCGLASVTSHKRQNTIQIVVTWQPKTKKFHTKLPRQTFASVRRSAQKNTAWSFKLTNKIFIIKNFYG